MDLGIRGRIPIVTGGSRGLGRRAATSLAREGARVAICARTPDALHRSVEELRRLGAEALGIVADVTHPEGLPGDGGALRAGGHPGEQRGWTARRAVPGGHHGTGLPGGRSGSGTWTSSSGRNGYGGPSGRRGMLIVPRSSPYVSQTCGIEPGDVIATGTPAGVGFVRNPPAFLRPGDRVVVRALRIGELANPVVREE